ncbi:MAG: endolytic transglycosylase MltG [Cellulosilyticaceae bacterium]
MQKKRSNIRIFCHILIGLIFISLGIAGSAFAFLNGYTYTLGVMEESKARTLNPNIKQYTLEITSETTLESLADILFEQDFIVHKKWFMATGKIDDAEESFIPGQYSISSNMSNSEILGLITQVPKQENTIKFTIPEGFTVAKIANRLHDQGIVDREDFLKAVNERDYDYDFLKDLPQDSKYKLEGYLFPDTYIINKGATPEEIIIKMLNRFEQVIGLYSKYLRETSYTLHEIITIASIIEQEAKLSDERPIISGVIYNRLDSNMKLQMCSTVQYVLEKRKANLSYNDLEIDSPYNTYTYAGLPVGPICAPGEEAIQAALLPENNDYFFFVLKDATSGSHIFSSTASEHECNKIKYQQSVDKNFYE